MRDKIRLELTVEEWHDAMREERRRLLRQVLATLRNARERGDEWYVWVLENRERRLGRGPAPRGHGQNPQGRLL